MKKIVVAILGFAVLVALAVGASALLSGCSGINKNSQYDQSSNGRHGFHSWLSEYQGDVDQMYAEQDVNNRLVSNNWFSDQYQQIQAQEANIRILPKTDPDRTSLIKIYNQSVGQYNAKAKQVNHAMWKDPSLPQAIGFFKENDE